MKSEKWFCCISDGGYLILESKYVHVHVGIGLIILVGEIEEMLQQPICRPLFWFDSHLGMHQCDTVPLAVIFNPLFYVPSPCHVLNSREIQL